MHIDIVFQDDGQVPQTSLSFDDPNGLAPSQVEQRLCRWLLLSQDRVGSDELRMTQEFIANMLGGRRESVTVMAV